MSSSLSPIKKRRSSGISHKSFHSMDQFKNQSLFDQYGRVNTFPLRPAINLLLILLTTLQVFILITSRIYLRGQLVRSFLSIYVDEDKYQDLFSGGQFYLEIMDIKQLNQHFQYMFKRVNVIQNDSFVDFFYKQAKFVLHTEYKQFEGSSHRQNVHVIDPKLGILKPFNMSNITDTQLYLLQVSQFQIQINNLTMRQNWQGFNQRYDHWLTYTFVDNIKVQINFQFKISNAMLPSDENHSMYSSQQHSNMNEQNKQRMKMTQCLRGGCYYRKNNLNNQKQDNNLLQMPFRTQYIVRIRVFFGFVLVLAMISLYLNYLSIRKTYKVLYQQLQQYQQQHEHEHTHNKPENPQIKFTEVTQQEQSEIRQNVHKWVQRNKMTISQIKIQDYFHIIQFDIIFSTLSNIFQIITAFYLVSGIQRQRMAGITCLFSWMTIFRLIRNYKKLVFMYELIKLSIAQVVSFFLQFMPVFVSYALLGVCLFPKVSFFSSMANSVTTLICLMMGDSIQMITNAIIQKTSTLLSILYIFSFVLLFMHAIHNTLTSIIKQFFIIKKIELVNWQKQRKKETNWIYIQQKLTSSEQQKRKLPLKLTDDLMRGLLRVKALSKTHIFSESAMQLFHEIDNIRITQKWMITQNQLQKYAKVKQQLIRRSLKVSELIQIYQKNQLSNTSNKNNTINNLKQQRNIEKQSLLTQN